MRGFMGFERLDLLHLLGQSFKAVYLKTNILE